ncbi:type II toxin-antitoxin system RelE/ParE family toxin [Selenomonas sputigena]|uniref:type II toxin-antitoxin system RelE/ParE family toxin n=1 Tax=Selenomonas sputigena TaxID=69823 RepID=UPI001E29496C|nr:type II toxin-antitoxin system RelE/ParE family toxin [Selenomonas sputigena]
MRTLPRPTADLSKKQRIVLTHGFIKKTQKTPVREIERAKKYRVIYCEREEN